jgi:plastocyanin
VNTRLARAAALTAALFLGALSCGKAPLKSLPPAKAPVRVAQTYTIRIEDMKFEPASLTVHVGDTVVWQNDDMVPHTAVGPGFTSPTIPADQSYTWKAGQAGSFPYVCTLHPMMSGSVTVE